MGVEALVPRMRDICGAGNVVTDPLELRTYECDGLTAHRCVPALVVLPGSAAEVAAVVTECARAGVPFVARGSGTGLSGGALPHESGVLIVLSRMRPIVEIDPVSRRAVVEPGVTNLAVSKAAAPFGLFYAPDPSSQVVCSVGGNVAENSGGAHCLKNGFTVHHVTGLEIVTPSGELTWLGDGTGLCSGLRPARRVHRLRGHARHRDQDRGQADAGARGGAPAAGRVRVDGRGRPGGVRHHRGRASCPPPSR